ncbi:hypothetical protein AB0O39_35480 [Streptomyces anulatus]|uniref:hypothetical protein n=1 Tax=Streptomyces anulatus TaxID=1892 RepID=UPI0034166D83
MSETTEIVGAVPAALRDWSVSWPQYTPTDVTPAELLPAAAEPGRPPPRPAHPPPPPHPQQHHEGRPMNRITLDGYLDTAPEPGAHPAAAHFDLIRLLDHLDATEPDSCAQVFACTTETPAATERILHRVQLGDLLRISGTVTELGSPGTPPHLRVHVIDVLDAAPLTTLGAAVLERYGIYVLVFADRGEVPVFTTTGRWVGEATTPDTIGHLIHAFENTNQP